MQLSSLDVIIVIAYITVLYFIAIKANVFMRGHYLANKKHGLLPIENHYIAGRSITFWEATMSIIATEISALAFITIPAFVYTENMNYMRFVIGAIISRAIISNYFLPKVYGKGLTIFEALARGIHGYSTINKEGHKGKRTFAFFYVFTKLIGVSLKLLGGATLVSEFFGISLFTSISVIAAMTYVYIILGGLKAVVRTDMLQASVFIFGGLAAHYIVGKMSSYSWGELMAYGFSNGKFSLFDGASGFMSFLYGILAGFAHDAATHGVDQDLNQKLFGSKDIETATKALRWSAVGSLIVNVIFLTLGAVIWAYYNRHGQPVPSPEKVFTNLIENYFPTPIKGLMVASILAACMSTLDSSINALSAVFYNDLMSVKQTRLFRVYINIDNFIITLSIVIVSYLFSFIPGAMKFGLYFAYLSTAPLLAFFICRMLLSKYIKINYSPSLIFLSIISSFLGMALNHFSFGFNPQLNTMWGIFTTILFMWGYSKATDYFSSPKASQI